MRELKFRVWDNDLKRFLKSRDSGQYSSYWFGMVDTPLSVKEMESSEYVESRDNVVIQQCLGRKDKNNKEIYEGDILSVKSFDNWSDKTGFYYNAIVYYDSEDASFRYGFKPELGGSRFEVSGVAGTVDMEVVGNICENPELMKIPNRRA